MCNDLYADEVPLSFPYRQFPPIIDPFSKQSNGIPRAVKTWHAVNPDEPAPMMHTFSVLAMQPIYRPPHAQG